MSSHHAEHNIDTLVEQVIFGSEVDKQTARQEILQIAADKGLRFASINDLYMARGRGETPLDFTVPAINIRGLTYDMARSVFKVSHRLNVGPVIFEIARSEMGYTNQPPEEYSAAVMAAAIKENHQGPVFVQGDHFQLKSPDELEVIKELTKRSIEAGFYNIDIDASTLVDYSRQTVKEQQKINYTMTAELTNYIRQIEPEGVTVSVGGEIGHIGGKNSTEEELRAYMEGFESLLENGNAGLSKVSIQTGTHHGGVVLADGSIANVEVDFSILKELARVAREYGMGGTVQHGASTLPDDFFRQFPESEAIEVHLATGFQNIVLDHSSFPQDLLEKMYAWIDAELSDSRKEGMTDEQFYYKLRKKAWGAFKKECSELSEDIKADLRQALEKRFEFMFKELGVENTVELIEQYI